VKPVFTHVILSRHVRRSRSVDVVHPRHHSPCHLVFVTMGEMPFALHGSLPPPRYLLYNRNVARPGEVSGSLEKGMLYTHFTIHT